MRRVAAALAAATLALGVAGCWLDGEPKDAGPRATTVAAWVAEFLDAVRAGDCEALEAVAPNFPCGIRKDFARARMVASARFGSGAVVDYRGVRYARPPQWAGHTQMVLVRDDGGGWVASHSVTYARREVGTRPPRSVEPFARAAATFNAAVAERNCTVAYDYSVTGQTREDYCKQVTGSKGAEFLVMSSNPPLGLEPMGGTANIQFFRSVLHVPRRVDRRARAASYVTVPVVRASSTAQAHGASNPYLVGAPHLAPTPRDVAQQGPYTTRVRDRYLRRCAARGETRSLCACRIEMIAAAVPYPDFRRSSPRLDRALRGIDAACRGADEVGATSDERAAARVALGGDLVPGYICSRDVSSDYVIVALGGSRFACATNLGPAAPDPSARLTDVTVTGSRARAAGTDSRGRFTVILARQRGRWLVADLAGSGYTAAAMAAGT